MHSHLVNIHRHTVETSGSETNSSKEGSEENQLYAEIRDPVPPNPSSSGGPLQDVVRSHTPHHYDNVVLEDPKPLSGDYQVTMCEAYGVHS